MEWAIAFLVAVLISVAVSTMAMRQSRLDDSKPLGLGEFQAPTADAARSITYIAGTVEHKSMNIFLAMDFSTKRITEEINSGSGIFSTSENVTVGFSYRMRLAFTLCYGPNAEVLSLKSGDFLVKDSFNDGAGYAGGTTSPAVFTVNQPGLYSQDKGGIIATFNFYGGSPDHTEDQIFKDRLISGAPSFRHVAYMVTDDAYWGNHGRIEPLRWEVRRLPDPLAHGTNHSIADGQGGFDANPAYVIYELLTNKLFGAAIPVALINVPSFETAAQTLFDEGFGISLQLDIKSPANNTIDEILKHIGALYETDQFTGKISLQLIRGDFDINTIPHFTDEHIINVNEYGQTSVDNLNSEFKVRYVDRHRGYTEQVSQAYNSAVVYALNRPNSVEVPYMMVHNQTLANKIAWRELRFLSFAPSSISLEMTRAAFDVKRGDVIRLSSTLDGFTDLVVRVKAVNYGDALATNITIEASEEVLALGDNPFIADETGEYVPIDPGEPTPEIVGSKFIEMAKFADGYGGFDRDGYERGGVHVMALAVSPNVQTTSFKYQVNGVTENVNFRVVPNRHIITEAVTLTTSTFTSPVQGTPRNAWGNSATTLYCPLSGCNPALALLTDVTTTIGAMSNRGHNVCMLISPDGLTQEFIGFNRIDLTGLPDGIDFRDINESADAYPGTVVFTQFERGLFDSTPKEFPAGSELWVVGASGGGECNQRLISDEVNTVGVVGLSIDGKVQVEELIGTVNYTPIGRAFRPGAPKALRIQGTVITDATAPPMTNNTDLYYIDWHWCNIDITDDVRQRQPPSAGGTLDYDNPGDMKSGDSTLVSVYNNSTDDLIGTVRVGQSTYYGCFYTPAHPVIAPSGQTFAVDYPTGGLLGVPPALQYRNVAYINHLFAPGDVLTARIEVAANSSVLANHQTSIDSWVVLISVNIPHAAEGGLESQDSLIAGTGTVTP